MCTVSVSRRKVCKLHSEWETVPNDEANRVKQTSHLLCLLCASDRMYWGRWSTVDCKGNKHLDVTSSHSDQFIPNMVCAAHWLPVRCSALMTKSESQVCVWSVANWCHNSNKYTKTPVTALSLTSLQWTAVFMHLCWWCTWMDTDVHSNTSVSI